MAHQNTLPQNSIIYPTHTCFDDAFNIIIRNLEVEPESRNRVFLVHALIKPDRKVLAHAWVEDGEDCYFYGILDGARRLFATSREQYHKESSIKHITRYSVQQMLIFNVRYNTTGPWKSEYLRYLRKE